MSTNKYERVVSWSAGVYELNRNKYEAIETKGDKEMKPSSMDVGDEKEQPHSAACFNQLGYDIEDGADQFYYDEDSTPYEAMSHLHQTEDEVENPGPKYYDSDDQSDEEHAGGKQEKVHEEQLKEKEDDLLGKEDEIDYSNFDSEDRVNEAREENISKKCDSKEKIYDLDEDVVNHGKGRDKEKILKEDLMKNVENNKEDIYEGKKVKANIHDIIFENKNGIDKKLETKQVDDVTKRLENQKEDLRKAKDVEKGRARVDGLEDNIGTVDAECVKGLEKRLLEAKEEKDIADVKKTSCDGDVDINDKESENPCNEISIKENNKNEKQVRVRKHDFESSSDNDEFDEHENDYIELAREIDHDDSHSKIFDKQNINTSDEKDKEIRSKMNIQSKTDDLVNLSIQLNRIKQKPKRGRPKMSVHSKASTAVNVNASKQDVNKTIGNESTSQTNKDEETKCFGLNTNHEEINKIKTKVEIILNEIKTKSKLFNIVDDDFENRIQIDRVIDALLASSTELNTNDNDQIVQSEDKVSTQVVECSQNNSHSFEQLKSLLKNKMEAKKCSRRGRPRRKYKSNENDLDVQLNKLGGNQVKEEDEVKVESGFKEENGQDKMVSLKKTDQTNVGDVSVKKKGRGRPKKVQETVVLNEVIPKTEVIEEETASDLSLTESNPLMKALDEEMGNFDEDINNEMDRIHQGLEYQCCVCSQVFSQDRNLKGHFYKCLMKYTQTGTAAFKCAICFEYFSLLDLLDKHIDKKHVGISGEPFQCSNCSVCFKKKELLLSHVVSEHELFKCKICEKYYKTGQALKDHLDKKHSDEAKLLYSNLAKRRRGRPRKYVRPEDAKKETSMKDLTSQMKKQTAGNAQMDKAGDEGSNEEHMKEEEEEETYLKTIKETNQLILQLNRMKNQSKSESLKKYSSEIRQPIYPRLNVNLDIKPVEKSRETHKQIINKEISVVISKAEHGKVAKLQQLTAYEARHKKNNLKTNDVLDAEKEDNETKMGKGNKKDLINELILKTKLQIQEKQRKLLDIKKMRLHLLKKRQEKILKQNEAVGNKKLDDLEKVLVPTLEIKTAQKEFVAEQDLTHKYANCVEPNTGIIKQEPNVEDDQVDMNELGRGRRTKKPKLSDDQIRIIYPKKRKSQNDDNFEEDKNLRLDIAPIKDAQDMNEIVPVKKKLKLEIEDADMKPTYESIKCKDTQITQKHWDCTHCNKQFSNKKSLKKHLSRKHNDSNKIKRKKNKHLSNEPSTQCPEMFNWEIVSTEIKLEPSKSSEIDKKKIKREMLHLNQMKKNLKLKMEKPVQTPNELVEPKNAAQAEITLKSKKTKQNANKDKKTVELEGSESTPAEIQPASSDLCTTNEEVLLTKPKRVRHKSKKLKTKEIERETIVTNSLQVEDNPAETSTVAIVKNCSSTKKTTRIRYKNKKYDSNEFLNEEESSELLEESIKAQMKSINSILTTSPPEQFTPVSSPVQKPTRERNQNKRFKDFLTMSSDERIEFLKKSKRLKLDENVSDEFAVKKESCGSEANENVVRRKTKTVKNTLASSSYQHAGCKSETKDTSVSDKSEIVEKLKCGKSDTSVVTAKNTNHGNNKTERTRKVSTKLRDFLISQSNNRESVTNEVENVNDNEMSKHVKDNSENISKQDLSLKINTRTRSKSVSKNDVSPSTSKTSSSVNPTVTTTSKKTTVSKFPSSTELSFVNLVNTDNAPSTLESNIQSKPMTVSKNKTVPSLPKPNIQSKSHNVSKTSNASLLVSTSDTPTTSINVPKSNKSACSMPKSSKSRVKKKSTPAGSKKKSGISKLETNVQNNIVRVCESKRTPLGSKLSAGGSSISVPKTSVALLISKPHVVGSSFDATKTGMTLSVPASNAVKTSKDVANSEKSILVSAPSTVNNAADVSKGGISLLVSKPIPVNSTVDISTGGMTCLVSKSNASDSSINFPENDAALLMSNPNTADCSKNIPGCNSNFLLSNSNVTDNFTSISGSPLLPLSNAVDSFSNISNNDTSSSMFNLNTVDSSFNSSRNDMSLSMPYSNTTDSSLNISGNDMSLSMPYSNTTDSSLNISGNDMSLSMSNSNTVDSCSNMSGPEMALSMSSTNSADARMSPSTSSSSATETTVSVTPSTDPSSQFSLSKVSNISSSKVFALFHKPEVQRQRTKPNPLDVNIFKCSLCPLNFTTHNLLDAHYIHYHRGIPCSICSVMVDSRGMLDKHLNSCHEPLQRYRCIVCLKFMKSRQTLRKHLFMHEDRRPYVCAICNTRFRYTYDMKLHIRRTHKQSIAS